jgi:hypothetical protein
MGDVIRSGFSGAMTRDRPSLSPSSSDGSSSIEPVMTDVKVLPSDYSQCEFSDLVDLIGMSSACHVLATSMACEIGAEVLVDGI